MKNEILVELPIQPNHKLTLELADEKGALRKLFDASKNRKAIGKLMYLMVSTRPDIAYVFSVLSRFMSQSREKYW